MQHVYRTNLRISLVFSFSWKTCNTLQKLETTVMQKYWKVNKVVMGNVKMANVYKDFNTA